MKKLITILSFILFATFVLVIGVAAQKKYVKQAEIHIDKNELKEAKTKLDMAFQDEKSKDWVKTYYVYGRLAQAAGGSDNEEFNKLFDNPFKIAYKNYLKAIELDDNMKNPVNMQLPLLSNAVINKGIGGFQTKDYLLALDAFEFAIKIGENEIFGGAADISIIYNAGLAAYNGKVYDKAVEHFVSCKELGYGGADLYLVLKNCYLEIGDSTNAANIPKEAFEVFSGMAQDEYVEWAKEFSKKSIAQGLTDFHGLIVKQASEEWGTDYEMVAYEIKNQCKAAYVFFHMNKPDGMTKNTFDNIRAEAQMKWGEFDYKKDPVKIIKMDWEMVVYEMKNQIEAYLEIF